MFNGIKNFLENTFDHIIRRKRRYQITAIIILLILVTIFIDKIIFASNVINEKYGVSLVVIAWFFAISEIFFILGIFLMLKGSGIFKIKFKDIKKFKLKKAKVEGKTMYTGLMMNRIAAIVPWIYLITAGWGKLPIYITLAAITEIVIVMIIGTLPLRNRKPI
ncbi:hypothetical protein ACFL04_01500 [Patescibacteria group bacterium]